MKKTLIAAVLLLSACAGTTNIHGSLIKPDDIDRLRIGSHNKNNVMSLLGSPSTKSTLNNNTWYYITDIKQTKPLQKPKLIKRQLISLTFDKDGVLDSIREKTEEDAKIIKPNEVTTTTQGQNLGFLEQIFLNITSGMRSLNK